MECFRLCIGYKPREGTVNIKISVQKFRGHPNPTAQQLSINGNYSLGFSSSNQACRLLSTYKLIEINASKNDKRIWVRCGKGTWHAGTDPIYIDDFPSEAPFSLRLSCSIGWFSNSNLDRFDFHWCSVRSIPSIIPWKILVALWGFPVLGLVYSSKYKG